MKSFEDGSIRLQIGDKVRVRTGLTPQSIRYQAVIVNVSPTGRQIKVRKKDGEVHTFFYIRTVRRYVEEPGEGCAGRLLNDFFNIEEAMDTLK